MKNSRKNDTIKFIVKRIYSWANIRVCTKCHGNISKVAIFSVAMPADGETLAGHKITLNDAELIDMLKGECTFN